jgi:hypothetical protein
MRSPHAFSHEARADTVEDESVLPRFRPEGHEPRRAGATTGHGLPANSPTNCNGGRPLPLVGVLAGTGTPAGSAAACPRAGGGAGSRATRTAGRRRHGRARAGFAGQLSY